MELALISPVRWALPHSPSRFSENVYALRSRKDIVSFRRFSHDNHRKIKSVIAAKKTRYEPPLRIESKNERLNKLGKSGTLLPNGLGIFMSASISFV